MDRLSLSISGLRKISVNRRAFTGSSHTLCQMPVTGVYQQAQGSPVAVCFPRGWVILSSSTTRTVTVLLPSRSRPVMSEVKGHIATGMGPGNNAVYPNSSLIVHSTKMQQNLSPCQSLDTSNPGNTTLRMVLLAVKCRWPAFDTQREH